MKKIQISWKVKNGDKTLRTFEGVAVQMFDTFADNVKFYGESFIQEIVIGTSLRVQIQNASRSHSVAKDPNGKWTYSDKECVSFAESFKPELTAGAQKYRDDDDGLSLYNKGLEIQRQLREHNKGLIAKAGKSKVTARPKK